MIRGFKYYEVRPCIELEGGGVESFQSYEEYEDWRAQNDNREADFWTLYGRHYDDLSNDILVATAIGKFETKEAAHEIMNAIIAPLASIRDMLEGDHPATFCINQCSNDERI